MTIPILDRTRWEKRYFVAQITKSHLKYRFSSFIETFSSNFFYKCRSSYLDKLRKKYFHLKSNNYHYFTISFRWVYLEYNLSVIVGFVCVLTTNCTSDVDLTFQWFYRIQLLFRGIENNWNNNSSRLCKYVFWLWQLKYHNGILIVLLNQSNYL